MTLHQKILTLVPSVFTGTMPASPADGMVITVQSTQQITALTIQGNTGQSVVAGSINIFYE